MIEQTQPNREQVARVDAKRFDAAWQRLLNFTKVTFASLAIGQAVRDVNDAYPAIEQQPSVEVQSARYIGSIGVHLSRVRSEYELAT